jgi:tripartite-type tricarboxylate transporter receptor subunit TctC
MKLCVHLIAAALALAVCSATRGATQDFPTKPVRIVIGYVPGGGADTLGRILAPKLTERWSHSVVLDNRPGASGNIGAELVANSAPDGYTLLLMTLSHAVGAGLYPKLPFHPADSFAGVSRVGATTLVLVTYPASPLKSLKDVIDAARARPAQLTFGTSGIGGSPHLAGELFKLQTGIDIVHVPYKGAGLATTDLLGERIPLMMAALPGAIPHVKSGRMRALGVTSIRRSPAVPDVPTIAESGLHGFDVQHWFGLLAPARTDGRRLEAIQAALAGVLRMPDVIEAYARAGADPVIDTPREFDAYLRSEIARWTKVVRAAGVKVE